MSDELMISQVQTPLQQRRLSEFRWQCQADQSLVIQQYNRKFTNLMVDSDSLRGVAFSPEGQSEKFLLLMCEDLLFCRFFLDDMRQNKQVADVNSGSQNFWFAFLIIFCQKWIKRLIYYENTCKLQQ